LEFYRNKEKWELGMKKYRESELEIGRERIIVKGHDSYIHWLMTQYIHWYLTRYRLTLRLMLVFPQGFLAKHCEHLCTRIHLSTMRLVACRWSGEFVPQITYWSFGRESSSLGVLVGRVRPSDRVRCVVWVTVVARTRLSTLDFPARRRAGEWFIQCCNSSSVGLLKLRSHYTYLFSNFWMEFTYVL